MSYFPFLTLSIFHFFLFSSVDFSRSPHPSVNNRDLQIGISKPSPYQRSSSTPSLPTCSTNMLEPAPITSSSLNHPWPIFCNSYHSRLFLKRKMWCCWHNMAPCSLHTGMFLVWCSGMMCCNEGEELGLKYSSLVHFKLWWWWWWGDLLRCLIQFLVRRLTLEVHSAAIQIAWLISCLISWLMFLQFQVPDPTSTERLCES